MKTAGKLPGPILAFSYILILPQVINVALCGSSFRPADNYLINCGSLEPTTLDDGRTFISDPQSASYLSTDEDILVSVNSLPHTALTGRLYLSARIFRRDSMYRFFINKPGRHFLRLHFHPLPNPSVNMTSSTFSVSTDETVLLHGFSVKDRRPNNKTWIIVKEYLVNITSEKLTLKFSPSRKSAAFVNAIELVSAPDDLIQNSASSVSSPRGEFTGLDGLAIEVLHRVNVGGPLVTPKNDTLWRTWLPDEENGYAVLPQGEKDVIVPTDMIRYSKVGATALVAPPLVYSTAAVMADSGTADPNFNLTWSMRVDPGFDYLIRLHFCDIVSTGLNELYFNVYLNGLSGALTLDLSTLTSGLAVPYYMDFVLNASVISDGTVTVQVGPTSNVMAVQPDAILNGFEVMKLSNSAKSLDGLFSSSSKFGKNYSMSRVALAVIGLALGSTALILICICFARRRTRRNNNKGYEKQKSKFSSWLLPLTATQCSSFLSTNNKSKSTTISSIIDPSSLSLGRHFTLNEIRRATKNFDEKSVVGVGGFGKVYLGELEDGTRLAVKRGNPSSSQGVNEFQTEIQLLSKLRHRHLVSLIGYCDEQSEMILVYEYVAHGPLRDHLYGGGLAGRPALSWRRRLEICIGAARGLHYLHTGSAQGSIIHRDVKTTNILLDENFVAKVSDFGLSRAGPGSIDQTHVSTAVKGSFGYLDPEYFRRQQLTEKSDVYSFGVVLFEVLCARPALDPSLPREQVNLAEWARRKNTSGEIEKIVDPVIAGAICGESLTKFVEAAEKCLAEYGVDRPSMGDVLWHLECSLQLQGAAEEDSTRDDDVGPTKGKVGGAVVDISDDSGVVVSSPMFLENFEGR